MKDVSKRRDRVLALSMRPRFISDLVGQKDMCDMLANQFRSRRVPHFYIISGNIGTGKTTIARLIALNLQKSSKDITEVSEIDWQKSSKYDIQEINAANHNGIDDIRKLIESMRYKPIQPSIAKVIVLDEAHQLTVPAQNALITETEDVPDHVFYIFCTSLITKIIPALKRRAFIISPRPLTDESIHDLVEKAVRSADFIEDKTSLPVSDLAECLIENDIRSPGLILQAAERYFAGLTIEESILFQEASSIDTISTCRAVASGDWNKCAIIVKDVTKSDIPMVRNCVLGYLKAILLKSTSSKAVSVSEAIFNITASMGSDHTCVPSFMASLCLACHNLKCATNAKNTK